MAAESLTKMNQESHERLPSTIDDALSESRPFQDRNRFYLKATGAAAQKYDFIRARGQTKTTSLIESTGHLIKSCLGGGVVAIHESYKECGIWTALCLNIFLGFAVSYCMHILCKSAQKMYGRVQVPAMTYPDLAEASMATGPWQSMKCYARAFRYIVEFMIVIDLFGACCVYQVVVARALKQLVDRTATDKQPSLRTCILALLLPCMMLSMITSLQNLAPFSLVSDFFIFTVAVATVYYGVNNPTRNLIEMPIIKTFSGVMELIGVCVFSIEGFGVILPIENNMTNPKNIGFMLFGGMSYVVVMVMIMGFFGYWGFGEESSSPITINFHWDHFSILLKVFMALMIYITFSLNFWIPFDVVWYYIKAAHNPDRYWLWERVYRVFFVILITLVAFVLPNVTKFIGLIGSFCVSIIGFIFPPFIELSLDWEDPGLGLMKWRLWKAVLIISFGAVICVVGTYCNSKELIMEEYVRRPVVFF